MTGQCATDYVLIDLENVQPANLATLTKHHLKVLVFVGANQARIPYDLAAAMQSLGDKAEYIRITGNGRNALDFHIAYYLGELCAQSPQARFHIVSKDTGFDPLIRHLESRGYRVYRARDLAGISPLRASTKTSREEKLDLIVRNLAVRGKARPRRVGTLKNTINSLFTKSLGDGEVQALVKELQERHYIEIRQDRVSYHLPAAG